MVWWLSRRLVVAVVVVVRGWLGVEEVVLTRTLYLLRC